MSSEAILINDYDETYMVVDISVYKLTTINSSVMIEITPRKSKDKIKLRFSTRDWLRLSTQVCSALSS